MVDEIGRSEGCRERETTFDAGSARHSSWSHPSKWDFSTRDDLSQLTRDCLHETGLWMRGYLDRYFG